MSTRFEPITPECLSSVNVTSFRFQGKNYTISTTDITDLLVIQQVVDVEYGYTGKLGRYETMLFVDGQSVAVYPFGDLPGHHGLGVFQRYDTEDEARDGHQEFVTRVQRQLESQVEP